LKNNPLDSVHSLPTNLESLDISETNVRNLPSPLPALQTLYVRNCVDMQSLPTLPNSLYYLEANGSGVQCISHYPIGPFPSWYTGVFVNDNALPLCADLLGGLSSGPSFDRSDEVNMNASAFEQEYGVTMFPNPATNQVTLQAGSLTEAGTVTLLNAISQELAVKNISANTPVNFNLEGLKSGVYFVRYTLPTATKVMPLMIK
jgi:Leucine-rich repeat (LRR) protein